MKKWVLSRKDSMDKTGQIESSFGLSLNLPKSAQAKCAEPGQGVIFVELNGFEFIESDGKFIPYLGSQNSLSLFPGAVVDEGAIRFLLNGADVMRPGVRKFDDWGAPGKTVVVREEKKGRAITVGLSIVSGSDAASMGKGPCLKNLHYVGDRFWSLHKTL